MLSYSYGVPDGLDEASLMEELEGLEDDLMYAEGPSKGGVPSYLQVRCNSSRGCRAKKRNSQGCTLAEPPRFAERAATCGCAATAAAFALREQCSRCLATNAAARSASVILYSTSLFQRSIRVHCFARRSRSCPTSCRRRRRTRWCARSRLQPRRKSWRPWQRGHNRGSIHNALAFSLGSQGVRMPCIRIA